MKTERQRVSEQKRRIEHLEGKIRTLQEMVTDCRKTIEELRKENFALHIEKVMRGKKDKPQTEKWEKIWTPGDCGGVLRDADVVEGSVVKGPKAENTLINM